MTVAEATSRVRVAAAEIARAAQGVDVALLKQRFAEHDAALAILVEAAKTEQAKDCLGMLTTVQARAGHA